MSRGMVVVTAIDEAGEDVEGATIAWFEADGTTPLAASLYAAPSGGSAAVTHETDDLGGIVRFADVPQRLRYTVDGGATKWADLPPDPADVLIDHDTRPRVLDGYGAADAGDDEPVLTLRSRNARSYALRVANVDDDTVLAILRPEGDDNDVVIVGDDGTVPTDTAFYATRAVVASDTVAARVKATVGTSSLTGVGALEALLENNIASSTARAHATLIARSSGSQAATEGLLIDGAGGHLALIRGYAADNTTVLHLVDGTSGAIQAGASAATSGQVRLPNATGVSARNAANTGNYSLLRSDASDNVLVGALSGIGSAYVLGTAGVIIQAALNVGLSQSTTGVVVGYAAGNLGFFGSTGAAKPSAYTQTYSTATKTHANPTATTVTDNSGGSASSTLAAITGGGAACENATKNAVASLAAKVNALIADVANVKQVLNAEIDDLQALNLVG